MQSDSEKIKERLDIVDVIHEYVPLKKAGAHWRACCPFHQEKTPSFMVSKDKQMFHCFGCGKGGDLFTFVEEIEGLEFVEALKLLADKAGVVLSERRTDVTQSLKNRLLEVNQLAAQWFVAVLQHRTGTQAREYLERRGVHPETIKHFSIGYAPEKWDGLTRALLKRGVSIDDLVASGLAVRSNNAPAAGGRGLYDRFRGRVMFPLWNVQGQVIGFTGRIVVEQENSGGKYVNTPQTPVFDKSAVLYGIDKARQEARTKDYMVLVEGQMDVIACHQYGMTNVVAASGTALTPQQVLLIKRYTNNVRAAFDQDRAGIAAAKRGMDIALASGMSVSVICIPQGKGKDPDECLKNNPQVWHDAVENAVDIMQFYVDTAFASTPTLNASAKKRITDELLEQIAKLPSAVLRDHWIQVVADRVQVSSSALREELRQVVRRAKRPASQMPAVAAPAREQHDRHTRAQEDVLGMLVAFGMPQDNGLQVEERHFSHQPLRAIYNELAVYYTGHTAHTPPDPVGFLRFLQQRDEALHVMASRLCMQAESYYEEHADALLNDRAMLIAFLHEEETNARKAQLAAYIKEAEQGGDRTRLAELIKELHDLSRRQ